MPEQNEEWLGWYCCPPDLKVNRTGDPVAAGAVHRYDGTPVLCGSGLHAAPRLLDALGYCDCTGARARSLHVARVRLSGEFAAFSHHGDKAAAQERHYLAVGEVSAALEGFIQETGMATLARLRALGPPYAPHPLAEQALEARARWRAGALSTAELEEFGFQAVRANAENCSVLARHSLGLAMSVGSPCVGGAVREAVYRAAWFDIDGGLLPLGNDYACYRPWIYYSARLRCEELNSELERRVLLELFPERKPEVGVRPD